MKEDVDLEWTPMRREADLEIEHMKMWKAESAGYRRMEEYQGSHIPKLIVSVEFTPPNTNVNPNPDAKAAVVLYVFEPFVVKGLVLEYVEGGDFSYLVENIPRSSRKGKADRAMEILQTMEKHDILNRDFSGRNCMVFQGSEEKPRVCMIDFGLCRFRGKKESEKDWGIGSGIWKKRIPCRFKLKPC